jgi:HPt (histidine-containing phosphotransfer) domain-containing protein
MSTSFPITDLPPIVIDDALAALNDDLQLFKTISRMVLRQIEDDMADIRSHVAANSSELSASSHRLKGSLGAIAAVPAHRACSTLNRLARCASIDSYGSGLAELEQEVARLRTFLHNWLAANALT